MNSTTTERGGTLTAPPYSSPFLDTTARAPMAQSNGIITYLEEALTGQPEGGIPTMSIMARTRHVEAQTYRIKSRASAGLLEDLKAMHGIDGLAEMHQALYNEGQQNRERELYKMYLEAGTRSRADVTLSSRWKRFLHQTLGISQARYAEDSQSLVRVVVTLSNLVAARHRRGTANFAVVNLQLAAHLQDCADFVYDSSTVTLQPAGIYPIGSLHGIRVYVNPWLQWDDNTIVLGRTGELGESGVYYCEKGNYMEELTQVDAVEFSPRNILCFVERSTLLTVGDTGYKRYYVEEVVMGKKPWWRKILGV